MTDRKSFVLYTEIENVVNKMPVDERGELFSAILRYARTGEEIEGLSPAADVAFYFIKVQLDRDLDKYESRVAAGRKGGEAKPKQTEANGKQTEANPKQTEANGKQTEANDRDNDNDNVDDNVNVSQKERGQREKDAADAAAAPARIDYQGIVDDFNKTCHRLPSVREVTDARKKLIRAIVTKYGAEKVHEAFVRAAESNFLCGESDKGWRAGFDWILKPSNFTKILEGNFDNRDPAPQASSARDRPEKPRTRFHNFKESGTDYNALVAKMVLEGGVSG